MGGAGGGGETEKRHGSTHRSKNYGEKRFEIKIVSCDLHSCTWQSSVGKVDFSVHAIPMQELRMMKMLTHLATGRVPVL